MTCTNMIAKLFKLKDVGGKGKGLFAKDLILKGTIVSFECTRCRRISKQDFESISTMEKSFIFKYGYRKADGSHLLPCDEIIYLNHSCNPNILDSGKGFDIVIRNIARDEEATYDYRSFPPAILMNLSLDVCVMKMIVIELSNQLMIILRLSEVN